MKPIPAAERPRYVLSWLSALFLVGAIVPIGLIPLGWLLIPPGGIDNLKYVLGIFWVGVITSGSLVLASGATGVLAAPFHRRVLFWVVPEWLGVTAVLTGIIVSWDDSRRTPELWLAMCGGVASLGIVTLVGWLLRLFRLPASRFLPPWCMVVVPLAVAGACAVIAWAFDVR